MNKAQGKPWQMLAVAIGAAVLAACSSDPGRGQWVGDYVTTNNFESVIGWGAEAATLSKEHARSGRFAVRVDQAHEYGLTFDVPLREASVHALKGVELEAWAYLPSRQASGAVVLQVVDATNNGFRVVHSEQLNLTDQVKEAQKWTQVQRQFALPAGLSPDYHLRVFLWRNNSPEPVYLDDLSLKALE